MKKKIAIIIQMLSGGGAERTAANMSIDLSKDYEVHLIVFDGSQTTYKHGGVVHDLQLPATTSNLSKIVTLIKRIGAVKRIKREEGIECAISLMEGANLVNILSKGKERVIVSERNLISFFIKGRIHKQLEKYIYRKSDCIVTLSEVVRNDLISNFGVNSQKVITIYNSVDPSKFLFSNIGESAINQYKPYMVTMGRLTEQKAQWHIIRAFSYISNKYPEYSLLILGKGELRESYEQYISKIGLENRIKLLGFQPNPHTIIANAQFFVFSSMVEGLGSVILEALACGIPVISTDCDAGPREILSPETDVNLKTKDVEYAKYGILTPITINDHFDEKVVTLSKEEIYLSEAMEALINDDNMRHMYCNKARERAAYFSPEAVEKRWREVIG